MRISVDLGFGYVKVVNEHGKKRIFPSVVALDPQEAGSLGGLIGGKQEEHRVVLVWPTGSTEKTQTYLVGDAGLLNNGVRAWEEKAINDANLKVKLITAIALVTEEDESPVDLAIGLPLSYYRNQKEEIKQALLGLNVQVGVFGLNRPPITIDIASVEVFPQGGGAYYSSCLDRHGLIKDPDLLRQPVGVIDIGYKTTDFLVMSRGKNGLTAREDLSGSLEVGMNYVYQSVQRDIEILLGKKPDLLKIEQAIAWDQEFIFAGKTFDLKKYIPKARKEIAEKITAKIKITWGQEIDYLSAILLAGGGGETLNAELTKSLPLISTLENPTFANAEGYLAFQALRARKST